MVAPGAAAPEAADRLLRMQATAGNRAVQRFLHPARGPGLLARTTSGPTTVQRQPIPDSPMRVQMTRPSWRSTRG
ncbi:hypothetical protein [Cellulomonas sp. URHB0016]